MRRAIDTNVLARYVLEDDREQSSAAARLIDKEASPRESAIVPVVVTAELWRLLRRGLRLDENVVADAFAELLDNAHLSFSSRDIVGAALKARAEHGDDHLVGALNREAGAETTFTFDKAAARHADFTLLDAGAAGATT